MSVWKTIHWWMLICLLDHIEGGTKITLLGPRTRIVLAGHDLKLNFNITLPPNTTMDNLRCYNSDGHVYSYKSKEEEQEVLLRFTDSRQSGVYHCKCKHAIVYLAVLVRDKGFEETYHGLGDEVVAPVAILTVLLVIFSTLGSVYICKSQAAHGDQGDRSVRVVTGRASQEGDSGGQEGNDEEEAADNSVYTTLESRPASIYEVLDPSASNSGTQSKKKSKKGSKKKDETASAEDGIFESVYANL
ncbi:uncharacterized protein si:ch211-243a20.4 isoform X2 [Clupea harengus]|uniref:Uncharacterized protein si:ch211-243a20.4 isoform X2 n=1 Tax=Clupea harengus TaxID=7950 RepID=A0A8M1KAH1_CLUHA|nr:uncharacterized protein si:ch211-243a20.4 isoform X2 [Clupea harengus]